MKSAIKRSGESVPYDKGKIAAAILKAINAAAPMTECAASAVAWNIANKVDNRVRLHAGFSDSARIEEIQDEVELALMEDKLFGVAKAYILYRAKREAVRDCQKMMVDIDKTMSGYLEQSDWRVNENANIGYSLGGLILHNSGAITANYWLKNAYAPEIVEAHKTCAFHIHDLSMFSGYCAGHSLRQLIQEGLGGVPGKITSSPARHLATLVNQMVNFLGIMQNEWAGAQAFSSFDTYLAPFVREDRLSYDQVKQCVQSFIFGVNTSSRWGSQAPFTNITLDWTCPRDMASLPAVIGGKEMPFSYGECQLEMDMVNRAFLEVMLEGDANGRGFQYPIPTYNLTDSFEWDSPNAELLFRMTMKYGAPYFANFINSDMDPSDVRSMCPLTGDTEVLVRSRRGISVRRISDVYIAHEKKGSEYEAWDGTGWRRASPNSQGIQPTLRITLSNNHVIRMGLSHRQPVLRDGISAIIPASELKVGDKIPYNMNVVQTSRRGSHDLGFVAGAYAGDGSHNGDSIAFSLDSFGRKDDVKERLIHVMHDVLGYGYHICYLDRNCYNLCFSAGSYSVVSRFIDGNDAVSKKIRRFAFDMSPEWRQGFVDGLCATDGARDKRRVYTASHSMARQIVQMFNTLGQKAYIQGADERDGRLGYNTVYCVSYPKAPKYGEIYSTDSNHVYWQIKDIQHDKAEALYCMEVENDSHTFMLADGMITGNCRLRLDKRELRRRGGGLFGSDELTGSIGVVTINLPQIGYLSSTEDEYFERLDRLMRLARDSLETKRKIISRLLDGGLYPYTKRYLGNFNNHFSTIGVVGMNESLLNFMGKNIASNEGRALALRVLGYMRNRVADFQEETGNLYNLEATPAESTSYRLARHDKERFPDIIASGGDEPYYTNSTQLPVDFTDDVFEALDLQDELQSAYTGGTVFHVFLGEQAEWNWQGCRSLVKAIASNYRLPYFSISPVFSVCPVHGYLAGEHHECPMCKEERKSALENELSQLKAKLKEVENES